MAPTLSATTKRELGKLYPGLDIRGDGGYAVFAGRNQAGEYHWLREADPDPFESLPPELQSLLRRCSANNGREQTEPGNDGRVSAERLITHALKRAARAAIMPASGSRRRPVTTATVSSKPQKSSSNMPVGPAPSTPRASRSLTHGRKPWRASIRPFCGPHASLGQVRAGRKEPTGTLPPRTQRIPATAPRRTLMSSRISR